MDLSQRLQVELAAQSNDYLRAIHFCYAHGFVSYAVGDATCRILLASHTQHRSGATKNRD